MSEINYQEGHETAGQAKPVAWRYRYVKKGITDLCEVRIRTGQTEVAVFTAYEPEE